MTPDDDDTARLADRVKSCLAAGVRLLQYRHKSADAGLRRRQLEALAPRCERHGCLLVVNDDWALVSAGDETAWNMMTVSWCGIGELGGCDVFYLFVRPQRYTHEFLLKHGCFTVSMFDGGFKKEMSFCGSKSGRDVDKAAATGLTPVFDNGFVYLGEPAGFIVGLENETAETLEETYQMARDWKPDLANWSMYTPWTLSDLFSELGDTVAVLD